MLGFVGRLSLFRQKFPGPMLLLWLPILLLLLYVHIWRIVGIKKIVLRVGRSRDVYRRGNKREKNGANHSETE